MGHKYWKRRHGIKLFYILALAFVLTIALFPGAGAHAETSGDYVYSVVGGKARIDVYNGRAEHLIILDTLDGYPVAEIGAAAFLMCGTLKTVTIPPSVVNIGAQAFDSCTNLRSVVVPEGVRSIGERAFTGCAALASVTIPESVSSIGRLAFLECTGLAEIDIKNKTIGGAMFANCSGLKSVNFGENLTNIGDEAFFNCISLETLMFPESLRSIGDGAFFGCSGLGDVIFYNPGTNFESSSTNYNRRDYIVPTFAEADNITAIYAFDGSLAHRYALRNDIGYVPIASVDLDGRRLKFDAPPIIEGGRTLVPMRAIFEAFGAEIAWDGATRTVTATAPGKTIVMRIGDPVMLVDGVPVELDVPPQIVLERTLVPVRAVSESFGATVDWDDGAKNVIIRR